MGCSPIKKYWLLNNQEKIENQLAKKHLESGALVLYDVSSTYIEGSKCELAKYGYNRDKKRGKTQIVFGLLCDKKRIIVKEKNYY